MKYYRMVFPDKMFELISEETLNQIINSKSQWVKINTIGKPLGGKELIINKSFLARIEEDYKIKGTIDFGIISIKTDISEEIRRIFVEKQVYEQRYSDEMYISRDISKEDIDKINDCLSQRSVKMIGGDINV